jgi:hypothetical protein
VPGKLRELTATARSATRRAPAAAYHNRPPRRRLAPPAPDASPFAAGAGFVVISRGAPAAKLPEARSERTRSRRNCRPCSSRTEHWRGGRVRGSWNLTVVVYWWGHIIQWLISTCLRGGSYGLAPVVLASNC